MIREIIYASVISSIKNTTLNICWAYMREEAKQRRGHGSNYWFFKYAHGMWSFWAPYSLH